MCYVIKSEVAHGTVVISVDRMVPDMVVVAVALERCSPTFGIKICKVFREYWGYFVRVFDCVKDHPTLRYRVTLVTIKGVEKRYGQLAKWVHVHDVWVSTR